MEKRNIPKKQASSNEDWLNALQRIEELVSREEIENKVDHTVEDIRAKIKGRNVAYCWSGGKDSIVLDYVCRLAGVYEGVGVVCNLEYPAFYRWMVENCPPGVEIINTGQDLEWLTQNLEMLFPRDNRLAAKWYRIVQHEGQTRYFLERKRDMLILGRRKADGNYTGKGDIYTNKKGVVRYSPIADWTHEEVLAAIHYFKLPMPPIYDWPDGYRQGTHPWPARLYTKSVEDGFRQVYEIDPSIVREAGEYIEQAKRFLEMIER